MKFRKNPILKLLKNRKAVSQVLAAIMMIFMFLAAIGVVWTWLFPAYQRFQTTNDINSMTSYMLRVDEAIYDLYGEGVDATELVRIDPGFGYIEYETGKNISLTFSDEGATYNQLYELQNLGKISYFLNNRRGVKLDINQSDYLKGPSVQNIFFVNGSTENVNYQGLTNLTLMRLEQNSMKIELEYRIRIYSWYDTTNDILSITVNILQIDIPGLEFRLNSYDALKIKYGSIDTVYSTSTTVSSDFYVDGTISGASFVERPLLFSIPGGVVSYDVNIDVVVSQFLFSI